MSDNRLIRALKAIFPVLLPERPFLGPRKYRLIRMRPSVSSSDLTRAELQIVNAATGMPDLLLVPIHPGSAGFWAELQPGAQVLVQWIDNSPEQPYICAFSTKDDPAWRPVNVTLDASDTVKVGPGADMVELGSGSEAPYTPGVEVGRVLRWGDTVAGPASLGAPLVLAPAVPGTTPIAKVKA